MTDLSSLSDDQLRALSNAQSSSSLGDMSDADLIALHRANGGSSAGDTAADVARSAAIGPVNAALGFAGAIPNISAYAHDAANKYLFDPLFNAISGPQKQGPAPPDINQAVGQGIEGIRGRLYQPQTTAGKYAESVTESLPAALAGPGGLAAKAAIGTGSGLGSEFLGSKYAGTPYEGYARLIGGIAGGSGSIAGSKGIEALQNMKAAGTAGQNIGNILGTGPIKSGAINRVAGSMAEDNVTPASAAAQQAALGPQDAMVMDLGRQLQGRAEAVAQHPGAAQNQVLDAVEGRTGEYGSGARQRVEDTLNQHLGPSQNVVKILDDVDAMVQQQATPVYRQVMANYPVINVPPGITSRPAVAQAMKGAESLAKNYGETLGTNETRTILSGDGYHIADDVNLPAQTSLKFWDYTKKALDTRINGMMRNGVDDLSSSEKADLGGLLNAKQALVNHLDDVTGGAYANARRIAATKPELHDAMDFGRSIFGSKLLPEEVAAQIGDMSIPAQAMAQVGARRELARVLDSARNDGAKARAFLDTNNNSQKIGQLFGQPAAQAIQDRVAAENTFQNATQTIAQNSRTSARQMLRADTETPSPNINPTLTGLALKPAKSLLAYALEHGMANTRSGIGQILTAKDQQLQPIVQQLIGYNATKAANAATPAGQQTAALVRALMSGTAAQ